MASVQDRMKKRSIEHKIDMARTKAQDAKMDLAKLRAEKKAHVSKMRGK